MNDNKRMRSSPIRARNKLFIRLINEYIQIEVIRADVYLAVRNEDRPSRERIILGSWLYDMTMLAMSQLVPDKDLK